MPIKIQRSLCQKSVAGIVRDSIVNVFQNSEYFCQKTKNVLKIFFEHRHIYECRTKLSARNQK